MVMIDKTDESILDFLIKDGRTSSTQMSKDLAESNVQLTVSWTAEKG